MNIGMMYQYVTTVKLLALCEWKQLQSDKNDNSSLKELSKALDEAYHAHFLCQVGNNHSHSYCVTVL